MLSLMNHAQLQQQAMVADDCYASYDAADATTESPQRSRVCRHFLAGRCTWGDSCRFSHEPPQMMQQAGDSVAPAAIRVGAAPISSHPMPVLTGAGATTPVKKATAKAAADGATSAADEAAQRERSAAEAAGVCRHFLVGRCTWGDSCRFSHVMPATTATAQQPECDAAFDEEPDCVTRPPTPTAAVLRPFFDASSPQVSSGVNSGTTPSTDGLKFPESCAPAKTPLRYRHNPYAVSVTPTSFALASGATSTTTSPAAMHRGQSMMYADANALGGFSLGTSLQLSRSYC